MKELSLRTYGEEEVAAMFKPKRKKKADTQDLEPDTGEEDEDLDEAWIRTSTSLMRRYPKVLS